MSSPHWRPLECIDLRSLREARLQAHYAVQWLGRAARAYIAAKPDDSHTNLGWDDTVDGFTTHILPGGARLGLSIPILALVLLDGKHDTRRQSLLLPGRRDKDVRGWLGERIRALQLDPDALDASLPWQMPAHPIGTGAEYDSARLAAARNQLAAWFANAHCSLEQIRKDHLIGGLSVSSVRCWPHHFDIATLISLDAGEPEHARSVNVGLSPGDDSYGEPYFYVSPWPYPDAAKLPPLAAPAHWHTQGFVAAVVPASRLLMEANPQRAAGDCLRAAVAAAMSVLT